MTISKSVLAAFGVLTMGLVLTVPMHGAEVDHRTNYLTFSGPVALPGCHAPGGHLHLRAGRRYRARHHRGAGPRSLEGLLHGLHPAGRAAG